MKDEEAQDLRAVVQARYARVADQGSACCGPDVSAQAVSSSLGYSDTELALAPDGANLGLGCGNPTAIASLQPGETVLDLGSGGGLDCFLAAAQVGPEGRVIGIDMTPEMIARARANAAAAGIDNVEFRLGHIEKLPVDDGTVDVVISNCVLNLSEDRPRALAEAYRVLKPGGRLVVSDMVSDHPVPGGLDANLDAVAACLPTTRADYVDEFRAAGFADVRIASETAYPPEYILEDEGVRSHIELHPEHAESIRSFAGSIFGAHFEATR
jgi:SAM-dependent methyltransferase